MTTSRSVEYHGIRYSAYTHTHTRKSMHSHRYDSADFEKKRDVARNSFVSVLGQAINPNWSGLWHGRVDFFVQVDLFDQTLDRRNSGCCHFCNHGRVMFAAIRVFEEQNITPHVDGVVARIDRGLRDQRLWVRVQDIFSRDVLVPHPTLDNRYLILSVDNRAVFPELEE